MLHACVLYLTLALCAVFIGRVVFRYDLYDREPWYALAAATLLGAVLMLAAGRAEVALIRLGLDSFPDAVGTVYYSALAGVFEEAAKLAGVALVAVCFRKHFNDPLDGLIYGSFAGLGAALCESVWILGLRPASAALPWQEPVRLAGHLVMGGVGGWGMGALVGRPAPTRWSIPACFAAAVTIHFVWDCAAFEAARSRLETGRAPAWTTGAAMLTMLGGMVIFRGLVRRAVRLSEQHFPAAARRARAAA